MKKSDAKDIIRSIAQIIWGLVLLLGSITAIIFILWKSVSGDDTTENKTVAAITNGQLTETKTPAFMGSTKEKYDQFWEMFVAKNDKAIGSMVDNGDLTIIPKETKVTVLENGFMYVKIQVEDGPLRGSTGFVNKESLQ